MYGYGMVYRERKTYTTHSPEQILILAFVGDDNIAHRSHDLQLVDLVDSEPVARRQDRVAAAREVPAQTDRLGVAPDGRLVDAAQRLVEGGHLGARRRRHGRVVDGEGAPLGLERSVRFQCALQVMHPDRERARRHGPPLEIVPCALH